MVECTITTTYIAHNTYGLKLDESEKSLLVKAIKVTLNHDSNRYTFEEREALRELVNTLQRNDKGELDNGECQH